MQYLNKTFTLPVTSKRMSQTEYEIAVGLRNPDGTLVQPKCTVPPPGWWCSRKAGHTGPCAARPKL